MQSQWSPNMTLCSHTINFYCHSSGSVHLTCRQSVFLKHQQMTLSQLLILQLAHNVLTNNDYIGFSCTVAMALIPWWGEVGWGTCCLGDIPPLFYLLYETLHRSFYFISSVYTIIVISEVKENKSEAASHLLCRITCLY